MSIILTYNDHILTYNDHTSILLPTRQYTLCKLHHNNGYFHTHFVSHIQ